MEVSNEKSSSTHGADTYANRLSVSIDSIILVRFIVKPLSSSEESTPETIASFPAGICDLALEI
jgi:hypothetical protein